MSKYGNFPVVSKSFKFFSSQVFLIFVSKQGSPENYSDFFCFLNLNNYVVEITCTCFGTRTIRVSNDFLTPKRFDPRLPFFNISIKIWKQFFPIKIKFSSSLVFEIFDSKHGSPENYSDFLFFSFPIEGYAVFVT